MENPSFIKSNICIFSDFWPWTKTRVSRFSYLCCVFILSILLGRSLWRLMMVFHKFCVTSFNRRVWICYPSVKLAQTGVAQPVMPSAVASRYTGSFSGKSFGCAFWVCNNFLKTIFKRVTVFNYSMQCVCLLLLFFPGIHSQRNIFEVASQCAWDLSSYTTHTTASGRCLAIPQ